MSLFRRPAPPRPVMAVPLSPGVIQQVTEAVTSMASDASVSVLNSTVLVRRFPVARTIRDRLAASGFLITGTANDPYAFTVTGWDAAHPQAGHLAVADLDERIDHLMKLRQRALDANHLASPVE